jgi:hypothetical protein
MSIALLAWVLVGAALAPVLALLELVTGPVQPPDGLAGAVLRLAWLFVLFVIVQQVYIRIERWDAGRSGRPPQR